MKRFILALSLGCLAALVTASAAFALHARPKSATPLTFRLVPAFNACTAPNSTHGAPLAIPSCNPPVQTSLYLTANAPDRAAPFNTAADGTGSIELKVTCLTPGTVTETGQLPPCPATGDQIDVKITATSTGVRCVGAPGQAMCAGGAGSLYNGKVLGSSSIRISDHYNGVSGTDPATVADLPFDVGSQCTAGSCNYVTSADATVTNTTQEGKRAVVGLGAIEIQDAGANGNLVGAPPPTTGVCPPACAQDDPARVASVQGLFIP